MVRSDGRGRDWLSRVVLIFPVFFGVDQHFALFRGTMEIHLADSLHKLFKDIYRRGVPKRSFGILYGLKHQTDLVVLMCAFCDADVLENRNKFQEFLDLNSQIFPTGVDGVGIMRLEHDGDDLSTQAALDYLRGFESVYSSKRNEDYVFLHCRQRNSSDSPNEAVSLDLLYEGFATKDFQQQEVVTVTLQPNRALHDRYACFSLRANFDSALTPIHNKHGIIKSLEHKLMELQIESRADFAYSLHHNSVFLVPGSQPCVIAKESLRGVTATTTIKDYFALIAKAQSKLEKPAAKSAGLPLSLSSLTGDLLPDDTANLRLFHNAADKRAAHGSAPLLTIGEGLTRLIRFQIDAFIFIPKNKSLQDLLDAVDLTKKRQFGAMVEYLRRLPSVPGSIQEICCPVPYHVASGPNILTLLRSNPNADDSSAQKEIVSDLYARFGIDGRSPIFHPHASLKNRVSLSRKNILNIGHRLLAKNSRFLEENPALWEVTIVPGLYTYHHYKQDRFDDDGWGCAYRSLQTIFSWFKLQGFTDQPIPDHRKIQEILVEVKDRERSLLGSKQWIGATEITRVLEHLLQVQCKIVNVPSGRELGTAFASLKHHFLTEGTPVMIGGGVYAYTICGVAVNRSSGEVKALVVDPHYVGEDDVDTIFRKNGAAWRTPDFWDQNSFYNLCCPLRP